MLRRIQMLLWLLRATWTFGRRVIVTMRPMAVFARMVSSSPPSFAIPLPLFFLLLVIVHLLEQVPRRNQFETAEDDHFGGVGEAEG